MSAGSAGSSSLAGATGPNLNSVSEMKAWLRARNVPHSDCVEKADLVDRVRSVLAASADAKAAAAAPAVTEAKSRSAEEKQPEQKRQLLSPIALCKAYGFTWSLLPKSFDVTGVKKHFTDSVNDTL